MADWIGRTLSKVTIQKLLGRGGMAEVYLGLHTTLNRPVAVKILYGHLLDDETLLARFRSEAQSVAAMRHPNIVQVFDFDIADDRPYIVMELLQGVSLEEYLRELRQSGQNLPFEVTAHLITGIANALDYAHAHGVVHRDVKPSNMLLRRESGDLDPKAPLPLDVQPVLTDFGVARLANTTVRTASGAIVGTPAYMSPEQVTGVAADARSDIYSLGVVLYEMLSGRLPFGSEEETVASTLIKHITESPEPLTEVPPIVQAVVFRALEKDPNARYQTAGEMAHDLRLALNLPITSDNFPRITPSKLSSATTRGGQSSLRRSTRSKRKVSLSLAVVVLLAVVGVVAILWATGQLGSKNNDEPTPGVSGANQSVPEESYGTLSFESQASEIDRVDLVVSHMPAPPSDTQLEVWLIGGESRRSMGVLSLDVDGNGQLSFVDDAGENLLALVGGFEITVEPAPDPNPLPTGDVAYSGAIPPGSLMHVRHLLVSFARAPGEIGLVIGVVRDSALITEIAQALETAQRANDLAEMKRQAEGLVNLIEGDGGTDAGDLDSDGEVTTIGDGFGLLPGARSGGYIQSSIEHARFAAGSPDATAYIIEQAQALETSAQNLGGWAAQLRDEGLAIIASDDQQTANDHVQTIMKLADLFANGQDANGNGQIEPILDEGGMQTMYYYARRMADMAVLQGANRMPAPANGEPASTPASES